MAAWPAGQGGHADSVCCVIQKICLVIIFQLFCSYVGVRVGSGRTLSSERSELQRGERADASGASRRERSERKLAEASGRVLETRDWTDSNTTHNTYDTLHIPQTKHLSQRATDIHNKWSQAIFKIMHCYDNLLTSNNSEIHATWQAQPSTTVAAAEAPSPRRVCSTTFCKTVPYHGTWP